jgi:hypothetical protein
VRTAGIPIKLERTPGAIRRPPPSLGADNASLPGADAGEGDPGTAGSGESAAPPR